MENFDGHFLAISFIVIVVVYLVVIGVRKLIAMEQQRKCDLKQYSIDIFQRINGYPSAYRGCKVKKSDGTGNSTSYMDRYDEVPLKDHADLQPIIRTNCFRRWTNSIEDLKVPSGPMFGFCTVLAKEYEEVRKEILQPNFSVIARIVLSKVPCV